MKTKSHILKTNGNPAILRSRPEKFRRDLILAGAAMAGVLLASQPVQAHDNDSVTQIGDVFVIAMENHDLTQPRHRHQPAADPRQPRRALSQQPRMTPGNSNFRAGLLCHRLLRSAGTGVHPSEPNYVWAEAGTDFGFHSDSDPAAANGNKFYDDSTELISRLTANGSTLSFWHHNRTPHPHRPVERCRHPLEKLSGRRAN